MMAEAYEVKALPNEQHSNVMFELSFTTQQAEQLETAADKVTKLGGPEAKGAQLLAEQWGMKIAQTLSQEQADIVRRFLNDELPMLIFKGMIDPTSNDIPSELPFISELEQDFPCLHLASRSQVLLQVIKHRAFAYDLDNSGKIVRFVGNFTGGGAVKINNETEDSIELSSHSGLALGAHTEAPYYCSVNSLDGHSPAPSVLILTARWNPLDEPTVVVPMRNIIDSLGAHQALALTAKVFNFTRSECFTAGMGSDGKNVSILDFNSATGSFSLRYNSYRFSISEDAPAMSRIAFKNLVHAVREAKMIKHSLNPTKAMVINNSIALHCRDQVKDNRRLLIRLFGYSPHAEPIVLTSDPLIVKG